jgi:hypothetical protein
VSDLDALPWDAPDSKPTPNGATGRKCRQHVWITCTVDHGDEPCPYPSGCVRCGALKSPEASRRGRTNRARGNRHELAVARLYGGEKTGPLGGPEDIRGAEYRTQVKTHQREAPREWRSAFAKLATQHDGRTPRLILRFLPGQGIAADDYVVIRGKDWLDRYGRDE